jgi:hypothetical protein
VPVSGSENYPEARSYLSSGGQYYGTLYFKSEEDSKKATDLGNKFRPGMFRRWFAYLQYLQDNGLDFKVSM